MTLVRISRSLLVIVVVIVAAVYLPYYYWMAFDVNVRTPIASYSPVENKLIFLRPDEKETRYSDLEGRTYTREEYEQLTPLANYRQLVASGLMPDSLRGVELDLKVVSMNNIFTRITTASFDEPAIQLFPLFESQSGRVRIEMPDDLFRIGSRVEFIVAATNTVDEYKSRKFTRVVDSSGFAFPPRLIAGNPTTRKPFDEGYFVVDAMNRLYHFKMVRGEPYCVNIHVPDSLRVRKMVISEMTLREFYGFIIDEENAVYLISYDDYKLIKLPLAGYDSRTMTLMMQGDLFTRTITMNSTSGLQVIVTDREYNIVDRHTESWPTRYERAPGVIASYLFPFTVSLTDRNSSLVAPYVRCSGWEGLVGVFISLVVTVGVLRFRKRHIGSRWFDIIVVALTGVFGLIAVHLIEGVDETL